MNKIPTKIKYLVYGISTLIFVLFFIGIINLFKLSDSLEKITGYFFGLSFNNLDYLAISSIPIFGMIYNSTRKTEFKKSELIIDILTVLFCVLIIFGIGLYLLKFIGRPKNPLIPQSLLTEPIDMYSIILIGLGIGLPFIIIKLIKK